ncbi:hypothetical protein Ntsu_31650 [Nocardia sp. IFM 10818]
MSRRVVANLVGRSEEWLRLVETGRLRLDSVEVMMRLAEVLRIDDFRQFIDLPYREAGPPIAVATRLLDDLRREILLIPALGAAAPDTRNRGGRDPAAELLACQEIWNGSERRFTGLTTRLPRLLSALRRRYYESGRAEAGVPLVRAYHLCREVLTRIGAHDLAWLVADRAMLGADYSGRPDLLAASAWQLAAALLHLGKAVDGREYALSAAAGLDGHDLGTAERTVLRGALHLLAAEASAALPDPIAADQFLGLAERAAAELGGYRRVAGIGFGPTEIGLTRMEMAAARRDSGAVIEVAVATDIPDRYPAGRRARYHIMAATAFAERDDEMGAAFQLAKAAEVAPEDLRYDVDAHRTLRQLLRHENRMLRRDLVRLAALIEFDGGAARSVGA